MTKYPIPVMRIASEVPRLTHETRQSWSGLYALRVGQDRLAEMITQQAAQAIAESFVRDVAKHSRIEQRETAEGLVTRFECVAMRFDELVEILYRAYREGQSDAQRYGPGTSVAPL